jgi:elongation factor Ts
MEITSAQIKELRDQTGISVMQCKKALEEAVGDMQKALVILKKRRNEAADKKSDRTLSAGTIGAYIHNTNEVAAFVVLASETDFVAKNPEFVALARDIAMQVAATDPKFLTRDDVSPEALTVATAVFTRELEGKPSDMKAKILEGKLAAYFRDQILLEQPFIKNPDTTIGEMVSGAVQKFGENIRVASFNRVSVK